MAVEDAISALGRAENSLSDTYPDQASAVTSIAWSLTGILEMMITRHRIEFGDE